MEKILKHDVFLSYPPLGVSGYFNFEADFVADNVRCIPMIARLKLDACGIKLSLKQWSKMLIEERNFVVEADCSSNEKLLSYRNKLQNIIRNRTSETPKEIEVETEPEWGNLQQVPAVVFAQCKAIDVTLSLAQWQQLHTLQRFALVKLCKSSHEHRNLPLALKEFQVI